MKKARKKNKPAKASRKKKAGVKKGKKKKIVKKAVPSSKKQKPVVKNKKKAARAPLKTEMLSKVEVVKSPVIAPPQAPPVTGELKPVTETKPFIDDEELDDLQMEEDMKFDDIDSLEDREEDDEDEEFFEDKF